MNRPAEMEAYAIKLRSLEGLLEDWARWYRGCRSNIGYNSRTPGIGGSGGDDFTSLLGKIEAEVCRIIDAAIDDLPGAQPYAIHHRYLSSVYRLRDYPENLQCAHERLLVVLPLKGVVI